MNSLGDLLAVVAEEKVALHNLYSEGYNPLSLFGTTTTSLLTCEAQALHSLIKHHGYKDLVEIGTGTGFSTLYFALALSEMGSGSLDSLDLALDASVNGRTLLSRFPVDISLVNFITGDSREIVPNLRKEYDLCLIDGSHEYETCKQDFLNIYPKIRSGGVIAFHDVQETLSTGTPYMLWKEIKLGSLVDMSHVSLVQFDVALHRFIYVPF